MMGFCEWRRSTGRLECVHCGRVVLTASLTAAMRCSVASVAVVAPAVSRTGPGTKLMELLAGWPFYVTATPDCPCKAYAAQMDAWGPDECARRQIQIVGWLRDEAAARGLPFLDAVGHLLVRRAISQARKATPPPADSGLTR